MICSYLLQNHIKGANGSAVRFVEAINSSHLKSLNLTYNNGLSDTFLAEFMPKLRSNYLRELKLSCISLTPASGPVIASYLSSPSSASLRSLKLNANHLGLDSLKILKKAIEEENYSLTCFEAFANHIGESNERDSIYIDINKKTKRNADYARCTRQEALALLPVARCLLLESSSDSKKNQSEPVAVKLSLRAKPESKASVWSTTATSSSRYFPFRTLPRELQHQVLANLCPILSPAQMIRIFTYACNLETLPSLKLGLAFPSSQKVINCVSDPTATMMSNLMCTGDPKTCLGPDKTLICGREEKRNLWLQMVECDRFELAWDVANCST